MSSLSRYDYDYTRGSVIKSKSHFLIILWCSDKEFESYKRQDALDDVWRRNFKTIIRDVITIFSEYDYDELMKRIADRLCARCDIKDVNSIETFVEVSTSMIAGGRHYIKIHRDNAAEVVPLMLMDDGDIRVYVRELRKPRRVEMTKAIESKPDRQSAEEMDAVSTKHEKGSLWSDCDDQSLAPSEVTTICEKGPLVKRARDVRKKKGDCSPQ